MLGRNTRSQLFTKVRAAAAAILIAVGAIATAPAPALAGSSYGLSDVRGDEWFATDDVLGVVLSHGLVGGYADSSSNPCFGPYGELTRGQVATVLWRMEGTLAGRFGTKGNNAYDEASSLWTFRT